MAFCSFLGSLMPSLTAKTVAGNTVQAAPMSPHGTSCAFNLVSVGESFGDLGAGVTARSLLITTAADGSKDGFAIAGGV